MKAIVRKLVVVTLFIFTVVAVERTNLAQQTSPGDQVDTYELQIVRNALRDPAMALGLSFTEKQINRLGDKLAIALVNIYSEQELVVPSNVRRYLPLLRAAFVAPQIVRDPADRKPAVTLLLLWRLEANASDENERQQVRDVLYFVQAQMMSK